MLVVFFPFIEEAILISSRDRRQRGKFPLRRRNSASTRALTDTAGLNSQPAVTPSEKTHLEQGVLGTEELQQHPSRVFLNSVLQHRVSGSLQFQSKTEYGSPA